MALQPKIAIAQDGVNGEKLQFRDVTGVYDANTNPGGYGGSNIDDSAVDATRIVVGDYVRRRDASKGISDVSNLELFDEYTLNSGNIANSNSGIVSKEPLFVLPTDPSALPVQNNGNFDVDETGRNLLRKDYTPDKNQPYNAIEFTPNDVGIDMQVFPDRVFDIEYELYEKEADDTGGGTTVTLTSGEQYYLEPNTSSNTDWVAKIGTSQYFYRYQVFIPDTNANLDLRDVTLHKLHTSTQKYFVTTYHIDQAKLDVLSLLAKKGCFYEEKYRAEANKMLQEIEAIKNSVTPFCLPNISGTQDLIERVLNHYDWLIKCLEG